MSAQFRLVRPRSENRSVLVRPANAELRQREYLTPRGPFCGVSILDRFANRLLERANEDWVKWLLCRYAEIAVELMCYGISRAIHLDGNAWGARFFGVTV